METMTCRLVSYSTEEVSSHITAVIGRGEGRERESWTNTLTLVPRGGYLIKKKSAVKQGVCQGRSFFNIIFLLNPTQGPIRPWFTLSHSRCRIQFRLPNRTSYLELEQSNIYCSYNREQLKHIE